MADPKPVATLSPTLLARKGAAKPAMRRQVQPMREFKENVAREMGDDLGWNDMGEDFDHGHAPTAPSRGESAEIVQIGASSQGAEGVPEVVRQREAIARSVASAPRRSALEQGRRAAFTLRLDAERHLRLRLASTLASKSAQQLVTEALDRMLAEMPDVDVLAQQVRKKR
ncbi:MAG: hypothetical protein KDE55_13370 [Novosphingobium sp.]|nr:hypothetical protein [Novosphingobium sp.]